MTIWQGERWRTGQEWGFWFRLFGKGLAVSTMRPTFSQRYGYDRTVEIGRIKIVWLSR